MIGQRVQRVEDRALLTGEACYTGDLGAGALDVVFVMSAFAHAGLRLIHTEDASAAPGVVAVYTAADLGDVHGTIPFMATDRIRFCGEVVAIVVATSLSAATAAAVLFDEHPSNIAAELAIDPVELRRRNLIADDAFPYAAPTGAVYDISTGRPPLSPPLPCRRGNGQLRI